MKERLINDVLIRMSGILSEEQSTMLKKVLTIATHEYSITEDKKEIVVYDSDNVKLIKKYAAVKKLAGLKDSTIEQYVRECMNMLNFIGKSALDITTDDLRYYLACKDVSKTTLNNKIRYINSLFSWLEEEDYIQRNPMRRIHSVKEDKIIKKPYTDAEMATLQDHAETVRDMAIIEVLYSTGCRVSEFCRLNRSDIKDGECVVYGKGGKERKVYFSQRALHYLNEYLSTRTDNNEALFVSKRSPHNRLSDKAIESILKKLGERCGIEKVHPHRFRRTIATNLINRGMPIQEVKELLGHEKIDTTMIYCYISEKNVKISHSKCA